jgi:hypothetical protein
MKHLIIGFGEIGQAIFEVLELNKDNNISILDKTFESLIDNEYDFIHICFPYNWRFIGECRKYKKKYKGLFVIHSTVKLGTCKKLGAVHSPVMGIHPYLFKSLMTFTKFFSGDNAGKVAKEFEKCGVKVFVLRHTKDTEAAKLWSTTYYGWLIVLNKELHEYCKKHDLDFGFINGVWNRIYNDGYRKLKKPYRKPILKYMDGKIGGHCVIPNAKILGGKIGSIVRGY